MDNLVQKSEDTNQNETWAKSNICDNHKFNVINIPYIYLDAWCWPVVDGVIKTLLLPHPITCCSTYCWYMLYTHGLHQQFYKPDDVTSWKFYRWPFCHIGILSVGQLSINQVNQGWEPDSPCSTSASSFSRMKLGVCKVLIHTHRKYNIPKTEAEAPIFTNWLIKNRLLHFTNVFEENHENCTAHSNNGKTWNILQSFHIPDIKYIHGITNTHKPAIYHFKYK